MKPNPTPLTKEQNDWQYELIKRFTSPGHANVHSIRQMKLDHEKIGELITFIRNIEAQAILQERNRIVEIVDKLKFSPKGCDENYWYTRGDRVIKSQVYWEAMKDLLKALENKER